MSIVEVLARRVRHGGPARSLLGAALLVVAAGCSTQPSATLRQSTTVPTTTRPAPPAGIVTWAEQPASPPNWIFPFASVAYYSEANLNQFQYLMYRPLYYFGPPGSSGPAVDEELSLATLPSFSNAERTVRVRLKGWRFSNGQVVDAQSVLFWMNMLESERRNWAGYAPGEFPENLVGYSAASPTSLVVTFRFKSSYNPAFLLYSELSQITPMPEAWDITALGASPGSGGCGALAFSPAVLVACRRVWAFDTDSNGKAPHPQMAGDVAAYGTNPLWKISDGPWKLRRFDKAGRVVFAPNPSYSGPQRPSFARFIEVPFGTDTAELKTLEGAHGKGAPPDVGYLPAEYAPIASGPRGAAGPNLKGLAARYVLSASYGWSISNYTVENFNSSGDSGHAGTLFRQLYIRQAIQLLVDQPALIQHVYRGYALQVVGPVPENPASPFLSGAKVANPYPYDPHKAVTLLAGHGWAIHPGGTDVCVRPGTAASECGSGIPRGTPLSLYVVASSDLPVTQVLALEHRWWSAAGVAISVNYLITQLEGYGSPCRVGPGCFWETQNGGWFYEPDIFPSGEYLFSRGADYNLGRWSDPETQRLIAATLQSPSPGNIGRYDSYLAHELPVIWQPQPASVLTEVRKGLAGVTPVGSLGNLTPEYWHKAA